ncbi:MAG: hypothetical protein Q9183_002828 [Haloplaca sp. 2 TL-2023]
MAAPGTSSPGMASPTLEQLVAMEKAALAIPGMTREKMMYQLTHASDDRSGEIMGTAIAMAIVTTIIVALRFYCRKKMKVGISWDDWTMLASQILMIGLCVNLAWGASFGTGRHLLTLSPATITKFQKLLFAYYIQYGLQFQLVKISILLFYRRVFPKVATSTKWAVAWYATLALVLVVLVVGQATMIFQCSPVSYFWTRSGNGSCINLQATFYSMSALTILTDIAILCLPMPIVWKLQMETRKKIGVIGIFLLGGFVCLATIMRTVYVDQIDTADPTWGTESAIWATVEVAMAIVCGCLPVLAPLMRTQMQSLRSKSWGSMSWGKTWGGRTKISNPVLIDSGPGSIDHQHDMEQNEKKPTARNTVYPREGSQTDEEMSLP